MTITLDSTYSYSLLHEKAIQLTKLYPKLVTIKEIGVSNDHRIIWMIKIGKDLKGPLFISGVHGRESINPTVLLSIIKNYSLYFIPLLNPDGYTIATEGYFAINNSHLRNICRNLNTSYSLYTKNDENPNTVSGGNTVNFFFETFNLPAITIETVDDEADFPLNNSYCRKVFLEIRNVPLEFLRLLVCSH